MITIKKIAFKRFDVQHQENMVQFTINSKYQTSKVYKSVDSQKPTPQLK